jgi:glycosyltransferase involved in cell wall biosynthesis
MREISISIVVSVCNGAPVLPRTIESILGQEGVDFEVVAVDDGSTDRSGVLLEEYAEKDPRLRVVHQKHAGLTRALTRGCDLARGEYIARQDAGDLSLAGRLRRQYECLKARPNAVLVSCGTRFVGPRGEHLYDVLLAEAEVAEALRGLDPRGLRGPGHHGSVMFRRAAYEKIGGYRREFYYAQDLDLWVRLVEVGDCAILPDILYEAVTAPDSLSRTHRREQVALTKLIAESAHRRRSAMSDVEVLMRAAAIRPVQSSHTLRVARSRALYFIGACLRRRRDTAAAEYFLQAVKENPFHLKAWCRLLSAR